MVLYSSVLPEKIDMTSHFHDYITTDVKQEILKFIKTGNRIPHGEEMFAALQMGIHGKKTTFLFKDDYALTKRGMTYCALRYL